MNDTQRQTLTEVASAIRGLSIDQVQKANSGHPGLPLGCAEIGAYLYGHLLRQNPKNSHWLGRDRFILSAGHGSAFLYSCLHLARFKLSLEELKNFRQLGSKTPGHPEYGITDGVEATTGPLGQGVSNAVGQALGLKMLQSRFATAKFPLFDNKVYCLAGDGCMMEGISSEASSLAGHLGLDNLVLIYDANDICLDGKLSECMSEDTQKRYEAYGFETYEIKDGNDLGEIDAVFSALKESQKKPALVILRTVIGKGSPNKAGTHKVHGAPLGEEEVLATKRALGLPEEPFYIPESVIAHFEMRCEEGEKLEKQWQELFTRLKEEEPERHALFDKMIGPLKLPSDIEAKLKAIEMKNPLAGRAASQAVLALLGKELPDLIGGSADLSCSDLTMMKELPIVEPGNFEGRNIKYGVREFAMAGIANGLARTEMFTPYVGTFFTFSDYMRNAIRLAALTKTHVIYQFTHDSILLGEDGPTHQPVEHLSSLRAMPGLHVIRPADNNEVKMAWLAALRYDKCPTALVLSRQGLPELAGTDVPYADGVGRGAYVVKKESAKPCFTLFATGSEVSLAIEVAKALEKRGKATRVVSMPCWEIFDEQDEAYKHSIVGGDIGVRVAIEAGVSHGWHKYIGLDGVPITIDCFGESAPISALVDEFGFKVDSILNQLSLQL